jgi:hypothetical protein
MEASIKSGYILSTSGAELKMMLDLNMESWVAARL